jgi:2-polyprenyl-6-methoxyphenol hydroxylase-like FAD-dependent oxidoreductase
MGSTRWAVVVGGGIGGLAAALALHRTGWTVTVLERAPQIREVGAGLTIMENGLSCLDELGVGAEIRQASLLQPPAIRRWDGRWLVRATGAVAARVGTVGMHRAELHRILLGALPAEAVRTDATVVAVVPGSPALVRYRGSNGADEIAADLVVAADGIRSTVRAQLWPEAPAPVYGGTTVWRAVTAEPWTGSDVLGFSWAPGAEFGMGPMVDGRAFWYLAINAPAGTRHSDDLGTVRSLVGNWHDPIPGLLSATDPAAVLPDDIYQLATHPSSFVRGPVALLGDAAHAMLPTLGQGAGQAMEDAVVLAAELARTDSISAALTAYDRARRPRARRVAELARLSGAMGQRLTSPALIGLRNAAYRVLPPSLTIGALGTVTNWRAPGLS